MCIRCLGYRGNDNNDDVDGNYWFLWNKFYWLLGVFLRFLYLIIYLGEKGKFFVCKEFLC